MPKQNVYFTFLMGWLCVFFFGGTRSGCDRDDDGDTEPVSDDTGILCSYSKKYTKLIFIKKSEIPYSCFFYCPSKRELKTLSWDMDRVSREKSRLKPHLMF